MIPIITKCRPSDDLDIDDIRYNKFHQVYMDGLEKDLANNLVDEDSRADHEQFINILSEKLCIFDPLDRSIPSQQVTDDTYVAVDQTIKRDELVQQI